jgi:hypothetical protein
MLQSALTRAAAIPALSLVLFALVVLITWHRAPGEAVPAPATASVSQPIAAMRSMPALPDDDDDIVDYSFVYPHASQHATSTATYRPRVVNIP